MNWIFNFFLRNWITLGLSLYFRQWRIRGRDKIPPKRPVILASNHQNAFLDALMVTCSSRTLPYYLARAGVFGSKMANFFLNLIRIMPIYRFRDGLGNVKRNDEIIERCIELLSKGEYLTMYPEGNHADEWYLRNLQRGLARIAFQAEEGSGWKLNIAVVPVGIQYENARSFRSRVLVSYGEPVNVHDFRAIYEENPRNGMDALTAALYDQMQPLIIHIDPDRYEELYPKLKEVRPYLRNYVEQVAMDKQIVSELEAGREPEIPRSESKAVYNPLAYPLAVWAWINNIIPYKLIQAFLKKNVEDKVFSSSLKFAFGFAVVPAYYLVIGITISLLTGYWWLGVVYFFSHPFSGFMGAFDLLKKR